MAKVMSASLSTREEDYLRSIHEILERKGYARIRDIANEVGVTPPSAVEMMRKLAQKGMVIYEKYGGVNLTPQGREIARVISRRHETFIKFLEIILVPKEVALKDAHILEHQLDPKTIKQFARFVEFITGASDHPRWVGRWIEMFKGYCEAIDKRTGEYST